MSVLLCSGKVFFDLLLEQERRKTRDISIVRIEQLYPYPEWNLTRIMEAYSGAKEIVWVQEEPENMGAWNFMRNRVSQTVPFGRAFRCVARPVSSSPSTGSLRAHRQEQADLVRAAFE